MKSGCKFLSRLLCFFQERFDKLDKTVYCHNSSMQSGVQMDTGKLFGQQIDTDIEAALIQNDTALSGGEAA